MTDRPPPSEHTFEVTAEDHEQRLDLFLVKRLPAHSRTFLQTQVREGRVSIGGLSGSKLRPSRRLETGDVVRVQLAPKPAPRARPEPIALSVLHEDEHVILIDKPPGLTVHPGAGAPDGTLVNALAFHFEQLSSIQGPERPGLVHRLDRDTSGVILVAKDDATHTELSRQFAERTVRKEYLAVCRGVMELDADLLNGPIGPHKRHPTHMAIRLDIGRPAETHYEVLERFRRATAVRCRPRSGRTHQIRVHLSSIGHAIVSDRVYGGVVRDLTEVCPRMALHAHRLTFRHPGTGEEMTITSPLPADIRGLLEVLDEPSGPGSPARSWESFPDS